jgi:hypothetical protein
MRHLLISFIEECVLKIANLPASNTIGAPHSHAIPLALASAKSRGINTVELRTKNICFWKGVYAAVIAERT